MSEPMTDPLRDEIEKAMRGRAGMHNCNLETVCVDHAVSVAMEMVRRERDVTEQITRLNVINRKRAEAAEILARREHPDDCSIMESAYFQEVRMREAAEQTAATILESRTELLKELEAAERERDEAIGQLQTEATIRHDMEKAMAERGHVRACGCKPSYGDYDTWHDPRCAPKKP